MFPLLAYSTGLFIPGPCPLLRCVVSGHPWSDGDPAGGAPQLVPWSAAPGVYTGAALSVWLPFHLIPSPIAVLRSKGGCPCFVLALHSSVLVLFVLLHLAADGGVPRP